MQQQSNNNMTYVGGQCLSTAEVDDRFDISSNVRRRVRKSEIAHQFVIRVCEGHTNIGSPAKDIDQQQK